VLAEPERLERILAARVSQELKAADSLQREDFAVGEGAPGLLQRGVAFGKTESAGAEKFETRAAVRATDSLDMESAVGGVLIFTPTLRAERKIAPRRRLAVVGERFDHRGARPAVAAAVEGVVKPAVGGLVPFGAAFGTGGEVGRSQQIDFAAGHGVAGVADDEFAVALCFRQRLDGAVFDGVDPALRRQGVGEFPAGLLQCLGASLPDQLHFARTVADPAGQLQFPGETEQGRTHADPFHGSAQNHALLKEFHRVLHSKVH